MALNPTISRNLALDHSAVRAAKKALRREVSTTLKGLSQSDVMRQSEAIHSHLVSLPAYRNAKSVSCYLSMPTGEVETHAIAQEVLRAGKSLYVPKIFKTATEDRMNFFRIYDSDDLLTLPSGTWGIKEPSPSRADGTLRSDVLVFTDSLDLIIVPGVAFDSAFHRLGHGKGYYDKFLSDYKAAERPMPTLIALALQHQIVDDVPVLEHDWVVDAIVTPDLVLEQKQSPNQ
ncbi:5-formyltetrahydrofolate cyclo-ligase [Flagelloscypha sp. PMI_526]|nr:5-formyltetrahydrofolate cyclo-ligase [Flagelloscypha sp. PMI_526]